MEFLFIFDCSTSSCESSGVFTLHVKDEDANCFFSRAHISDTTNDSKHAFIYYYYLKISFYCFIMLNCFLLLFFFISCCLFVERSRPVACGYFVLCFRGTCR